MVRNFRVTALVVALSLSWAVFAAEGDPSVAKSSAAAAQTAPTAAKASAVILPPTPGAQTPAASNPADKSANRFVERAGSGGSKVVRTAPPVVAPPGPVGRSPDEINRAIAEAQKVGGEPLDAIQREINLPGLKKDDPSLKPFVLHTRNGVNEIVKMSGRLLNRIATPFKKPVLIDTTDSTSKIVGSDIYYTPSGEKPIGLYIVDSANTSQTISLTVIPAYDIPGQNLIVKLEDLRALENLSVAAASQEEADIAQPKNNDYTGNVRSIMTQAVRGKPVGFSPVPLEGGMARMGTLEVTPEIAFTGSVLDIYRYRIRNAGDSALDLAETAFFRKGVRAVSFFPRLSLQPGQEGYVFLLADKPQAASMEAQ